MKLQDAVALIKYDGITAKQNAQWADLGCGSGLFTYALASLLQKGGAIHAVDKSPVTLQRLANPHNITIYTKQLDFVHQPWPFHELDGILMANSLHFVSNKSHFINTAVKQLKDDGAFLIVEYDMDSANPWVPHPISCRSLEVLFSKAGYNNFTKLHTLPSIYHTGNIYAAIVKK